MFAKLVIETYTKIRLVVCLIEGNKNVDNDSTIKIEAGSGDLSSGFAVRQGIKDETTTAQIQKMYKSCRQNNLTVAFHLSAMVIFYIIFFSVNSM